MFKSVQGKVESKMILEKATIIEINNSIVWLELTKTKLLQQVEKMISVKYDGDLG